MRSGKTLLVLISLMMGTSALNGQVWPVAPAPGPPSTAKPPTPHPLDPLTEDEIKAVVKLLKAEKKASRATYFSYLGLQEPAKASILEFKPGDPIVRRASVLCWDARTHATTEGVVNLTDKKVESWTVLPGVQAIANGEIDFQLTERIVRADSRWQAAVRKRGFDPIDVDIFPMPVRGYLDRPSDGSRYTLAGSVFDEPEEWAELQGLLVLVNITKRKIEWIRDDPGAAVRSRAEDEFNAEMLEAKRDAPKPLRISQPEGNTFQIDGSEIRWQKWRFRLGHDPRTGVVLHTVGYEDGGKVRSVLFRGSLSELYVPYGDPKWVLMHFFDAGEVGLGFDCQSPLTPFNDAPENAKLLPVVTHTPRGDARTVPNAVAVYERDAGVLWRHGDDSRRARQLVVGCIYTVGNYDYGLSWVFHQDGTLSMEVDLTGIMITRQVDRKSDPENGHGAAGSVGKLVAPNLQAPNHQHFFNFRLDLDVDGPVKNALFEMNVEPVSGSEGNDQGNGFAMKETLLRTEKAAQRKVNPASARSWKLVNPAVKNALGQPSAYMLMPEGNAIPYALPNSYLGTVGAFAEHHLWATPYTPGELYAAGTHVRDGRPTDGLPKWTAGNRPIEFEDVVLWYTVGVTHLPRVEEWPVMTVHKTGFKLMPAGFFSKNPALDVPETKGPKPPASG